MSLVDLSADDLIALLETGEVTALEVTEAHLDQIHQFDESLGAFLHVDREGALASAESIDQKRKSGTSLGPLAGLPVAVKDVLCDQNSLTTCASRMLQSFRPPYDATVVARLKKADAILLGRTNMDEFAMGGSTENSAFQATRNPWDAGRTPGGSSGGAAACVAARMTPLSLGTDTGGSIRQPASFCGVVGVKPTYGRISRYGLVAFASSLDQVGPLARTTRDAALLLETIAGHDPKDATSLPSDVPAYRQSIDQPLQGLRLGIVPEHFAEGLDPQIEASVRQAIQVYKSLGATVREVSLPHSRYAVATYYILAPSEASSNLARYDGAHYGYRTDEKKLQHELNAQRKQLQEEGDSRALSQLDNTLVRMYRNSRSEGFGDEVKRRIMLGTYALSAGYYDAYYLKASKVRRLIRQDYDHAFEQVDLILGPVTATPAFKLGAMTDDPLAMYLIDMYTVSANLAGLPSLSLPCGLTEENLPIGLHLQAPPLNEQRLLRGARMFEQATEWHSKKPEMNHA